MIHGVPVIPCRECGIDTLNGVCDEHRRAARRRNRHPGYDDPVYRRVRAERKGSPCDRCKSRLGAILHHVDGDPGNNVESNYRYLCKVCAPIEDAAMRARRTGNRRRGKSSPWR